MNNQLRSDFRRFLATSGYCTPPGRAACALQSARTLAQWRELEAQGRVRLVVNEEFESMASVFGQECADREQKYVDKWGCWHVRSEYLSPDGQWKGADSIGMCVYQDPADPFDNDYVISLMATAITAHDQAWNEVPA